VYRLSLALLLLLTMALPAAADKQKQMVQFDSVLFVRGNGTTGKTNIILFDNGTAQVLASNVLTPSFGTPDFFPSNSAEGVLANEWASGVIRDCPLERTCIRWQSIAVLRTSKKHRLEIGLGIGNSFVWIVPVNLAISDISKVIELGDSSLISEKDWKDYTDKLEHTHEKAVEQQQQVEAQEKKKEADANTKKAIAMLNATQNRSDCLLNLRAGDLASKVYRCGYPDHTNSDLHTDQLVYPNDIFVYIDKATGTVSDVQWKH
jgi:hypothetical protein